MADEEIQNEAQPKLKGRRVAYIADGGYKVILNAGRRDGVKRGDRFVIYQLSEEPIVDPITKEPLEPLKTIRGYGEVVLVQDKICTVTSSKKARLSTSSWGAITSALSALYPDRVYEDEKYQERPFDSPEVGDLADQY